MTATTGAAAPHSRRGSTAIGIDIGGTGIKGSVVDPGAGTVVGERLTVPTPHPAGVDALASAVGGLVETLGGGGRVGVTFPGVIKGGIARSAANVDRSWIGVDAQNLFSRAVGVEAYVLNDADAAGVAEARHGAARDVNGVVMVLTFGTGIGSALFVDGALVPNTELGHLELDGFDAEKRAAASVKSRDGLDYPEWTARVRRYLRHVEALFSPDLFVLGGGISADADSWMPGLDLSTPVRAAHLVNDAGIVGAAVAAAHGTWSRPE